MPRGNPENLNPASPSEVRNPEGRNQYSYRRDFEQTIDRLLAGVATKAEITEAHVPECIRERGVKWEAQCVRRSERSQ